MTPPAASTEFGKMWLFFARDSNYSDSPGIMPLQHLTLAIPGETLADISPNLDELQSGNLLATWTALWDPVLLAQTASLPAAKPAADVLELPRASNELVIAPAIIGSEVADRWPADDPLLVYLPTFDRRSQVISHLASVLPGEPLLGAPLAADFFAFGFAYLQIELLTRSMNYDPQVAQESLRTAVVEAAGAAMAGDETAMVTQLEQAYDLLVQSRNHYYPIDFYLVDLMLTTVSVAGRPLAEACRRASQSNVLVTGELLDHLASSEPDSLVALRQALDEQRLAVCGGSMTSEPLHQLSPESLLANLRDGRAALERHLGRAPTVFAHAAGPMAPLVPGVLHRLGYHASVLANFSGGTLPGSHGSRTTWTGLDNTPIEALAAEPIDMGGHCSMLGLAKQMQRTMNYDLAASLLLVGWPGHRTEWHGDLMQVAKRSAVLGRPITLDEYFDITSSQDYAGTTTADAYPQPATLPVAHHNNDRIAALARISGSQQPSPTALHELLTVAADQPANGTLWLNASSVPRRHLGGELPAFGWRWESNSSTAEHPPRCESGVLRNEHLEAVFDERTGGISATRLHAERGNYLSQQLVVEPLGPQGLAAGLQLAFDGWRSHSSRYEPWHARQRLPRGRSRRQKPGQPAATHHARSAAKKPRYLRRVRSPRRAGGALPLVQPGCRTRRGFSSYPRPAGNRYADVPIAGGRVVGWSRKRASTTGGVVRRPHGASPSFGADAGYSP